MLLAAPATILTAAVTVLAALICLGTAILVARTRATHKVAAPAMTGALPVECALRVQGNTLEQAVVFLPLLWMAAIYFQGWLPPILGLVWCLGRIIYAIGYMSAPNRRAPGFILSVLSSIALAILAIVGIAGAWGAV